MKPFLSNLAVFVGSVLITAGVSSLILQTRAEKPLTSPRLNILISAGAFGDDWTTEPPPPDKTVEISWLVNGRLDGTNISLWKRPAKPAPLAPYYTNAWPLIEPFPGPRFWWTNFPGAFTNISPHPWTATNDTFTNYLFGPPANDFWKDIIPTPLIHRTPQIELWALREEDCKP